MHVDLIGAYSKSIGKKHTAGAIINNNGSLTCMEMVGPDMGWFEIFKNQRMALIRLWAVMMSTWINNLTGLAGCL